MLGADGEKRARENDTTMKKLLTTILTAALLLVPVALTEQSVKVAYVYVSPIGDAGWTYQHDLGRKAVEKKYGDKVSVSYVENVPEGADAERVINNLAKKGNAIIFTTSFGYMEPTLAVAKRYPKVAFEHATGYKTAKNVGNYLPRFYEGRYLGGIVAGETTQTNTLGYVAAFPIPEVIRGINAFTLGAKSVNPDIEVKVIWVNSWYDPGKEREAAEALLAQGADVVTHHTDSPAAVQAAQEKGKFAVAYHSDMSQYGPDAQIAAVVHNWEKYYIERVGEVMNGTWYPGSVWQGMKEGMVDIKMNDSLSEGLKARITDKKAGIINGDIHPFQGPVTKQDGTLVVKLGETMSDGDMLNMNYYVEGVNGNLPQ